MAATSRAAAAAPLAATTTTLGAATRGTTVASRAFTLMQAASPGGGARPARAGPLPLAMRKVTGPDDDQMVDLVLVFPLLEARSRRRSAPSPKGTPLVVDVRATDFGQQLFEARIAPLVDQETAPHLRWVAVRDCPTTG